MVKKLLLDFMGTVIHELELEKKYAAAHVHLSCKHIFEEFSGSEKIYLHKLTPGVLMDFQKFLLLKQLSWNTVSTYMRALRATYYRSVVKKYVSNNPFLFRKIHTSVDSKTKRAMSPQMIKMLFDAEKMDLPEDLRQTLTYFILMFSFRGMPFIDLAHLRKCDIKGDLLSYHRHKTGAPISIKLSRELLELIMQYADQNPDSPYLFPILSLKIKNEKDRYLDYQRALRLFNAVLYRLSLFLKLGVCLSSYVARHTWATMAYHMGVPVGAISRALGHTSIKTTESYLSAFTGEEIDHINSRIIKQVKKMKSITNERTSV